MTAVLSHHLAWVYTVSPANENRHSRNNKSVSSIMYMFGSLFGRLSGNTCTCTCILRSMHVQYVHMYVHHTSWPWCKCTCIHACMYMYIQVHCTCTCTCIYNVMYNVYVCMCRSCVMHVSCSLCSWLFWLRLIPTIHSGHSWGQSYCMYIHVHVHCTYTCTCTCTYTHVYMYTCMHAFMVHE